MSSPGRTHISWQSEQEQIRELTNYIFFLEAKVKYLQAHHESCLAFGSLSALPPSAPYTPPDIDEKDPVSSENDEVVPRGISSSRTSVAPGKKSASLRWKRIIDQMTQDWMKGTNWQEQRAAIGLKHAVDSQIALEMILETSSVPSSLQALPGVIEADQPVVTKRIMLLQSAKGYATSIRHGRTLEDVPAFIHLMREFVLISFCVVLEQQSIPPESINEVMRICTTGTGAANLYRLRRGALWVNRVITGLINQGWGHQATEFFLISGRPVSQYGLLWEACAHSFPYLTMQLAQIKEQTPMSHDPVGWTAF